MKIIIILVVLLSLPNAYSWVNPNGGYWPQNKEKVFARPVDSGTKSNSWYYGEIYQIDKPRAFIGVHFFIGNDRKRPWSISLPFSSVAPVRKISPDIKKGERVFILEKDLPNGLGLHEVYRFMKKEGNKFIFKNLDSNKIVRKKDISKVYSAKTANVLSKFSCGKRVNLLRHKWVKEVPLPQYNQGNQGICYGFAGMQMVDFWRYYRGIRITKKIGLGDAIYASLLARVYSKGKVDSIQSGQVSDTLNGIRTYGMCREDVIDKSLKRFAKSNNLDSTTFNEVAQWFVTSNYKTTLKNATDASENIFYDDELSFKAEVTKRVFASWKKRGLKTNNLDLTNFIKAIEPYLKNGNYVAFLKDVFADCFKKENIYLSTKRLSKFSIKNTKIGSTDWKMFSSTVKYLETSKALPLGLSYCAKAISDRSSCGHHASLIVGKRTRGGRCQFLVRNSWGNSCKYLDHVECKRDRKGREIGLWVNAFTLLQNTIQILAFDP